jgi:predicted SAM-dependent methyltransferase
MKYKFVNLGCGSNYIKNSNWINLDFNSSDFVQKADLLQRLPLKSESCSVVYSSHFLEHVPYSKVNNLLIETLRILKPGGILRLVLPDFEEMVSTYIALRKKKEHDKADFLIMEIIDQCVRNVNGGELGCFYEKIKNHQDKYKHLVKLINKRTGNHIKKLFKKKGNDSSPKNFQQILSSVISRIKKYYIKIVLLALPSAFLAQNVSLAEIGERHHWVWDFYSLKKVLEAVGYSGVKKYSANKSLIKNFPFFPLDIDTKSLPRRGIQSMYIEAIKK